MRLIDADKLFLHLNNWALAEAPTDFDVGEVKAMREVIYKTIKDCMRAVDEQPTAYDVDKVVEELWKLKQEYIIRHIPSGIMIDATDIVKRGGVNNDGFSRL